MNSINHHLHPVKTLLLQTYAVPYYQRDYKWSKKQFEELLNDLQEEFNANYKPEHGRTDVSKYGNYFLGTVLTTNEQDSPRKIIIDGQQRITSLCILYIYLLRQNAQALLENPPRNLGISGYTSLVKSESFGTNDFNIEVDGLRFTLFNELVDFEKTDDDLAINLDFLEMADEGTKNLYERYRDINEILNDDVKEKIEYFSDWIAHKVVLFEIVLPTEHDAHKVFLTMNDRGLNLSPIEMLKGELLSKITDHTRHSEAHSSWVTYTRKLQDCEKDEDSNFIKTWLRAKYADDMRGKKDIEKRDYEQIGDFYHRWVHDNKAKLSLSTHDDFYNFITSKFKKFADVYLRLSAYSTTLNEEYAEVFYNADKDITLQSMVILASICDDDTDIIVNRKIKIISKYLDIYTTARVINDKKNTYDNLKEPLFNLILQLRNKTESELVTILRNEFTRQALSIDNIINVDYGKVSTPSILHLLARISNYLEQGSVQTNRVGFPTYIDRKRNTRTFDIEHILVENYDVFTDNLPAGVASDFDNRDEFKKLRNNIGNLILLPRSRNRSLNASPYIQKLAAYATENISAQTLSANFYQNNPEFTRFLDSSGLTMHSYDNFMKSSLLERQELYKNIASKIYNIDDL